MQDQDREKLQKLEEVTIHTAGLNQSFLYTSSHVN
jgi:hypothetical protein